MDHPEELEFAWLMLIGITLTFLLSLAIVVFFVYYQRRLFGQKAAMEQLKREEQEKRLESVMAAQENERGRIARDLHDEVGVMLSTVKLYLTHRDQEDALGRAEQLLDQSVAKLRSISRGLSSDHLAQFGLERALKDLCEPMEATGELEIHRSYSLGERLPRETELQLHRIVQELLNNTLKHARANQVHIDLKKQDGSVLLDYRDDGVGFDRQVVEERPSLGLRTLSGRVEILRGSINITSSPGQGTRVTVVLPLLRNGAAEISNKTDDDREYHPSTHLNHTQPPLK